jgi:hypothetical protein
MNYYYFTSLPDTETNEVLPDTEADNENVEYPEQVHEMIEVRKNLQNLSEFCKTKE